MQGMFSAATSTWVTVALIRSAKRRLISWPLNLEHPLPRGEPRYHRKQISAVGLGHFGILDGRFFLDHGQRDVVLGRKQDRDASLMVTVYVSPTISPLPSQISLLL